MTNQNEKTEHVILARAVIDAVMDPIFVLDKNDLILDSNQAACQLCASTREKLTGSPARSLFRDWPDGIVAALDFPEAETEIELPLRRRFYRISVVSGARHGESSWKILTFNDITGERQLTHELEDINNNLERIVLARTESLQAEIERRTSAERDLQQLNREMATTQRELLRTLSSVVESRSSETAHHVTRVAELSRMLAEHSGMNPADIDILVEAAPMHDIGKIGVPDAILTKPGLLTNIEREVMKTHTQIGYEILRHSDRSLLKTAAVIAHEHHERWDGKGYPRGIEKEAISLNGRILAICDVFDALITPRVYKAAWEPDRVHELFVSEKEKAFDPELCSLLLCHFDQALTINAAWQ